MSLALFSQWLKVYWQRSKVKTLQMLLTHLIQIAHLLFQIMFQSICHLTIPDHLTCLLKNLYASQATARTGHGTSDWFQIGKGVRQGCILSPCSFSLYAEYIMQNVGLDKV